MKKFVMPKHAARIATIGLATYGAALACGEIAFRSISTSPDPRRDIIVGLVIAAFWTVSLLAALWLGDLRPTITVVPVVPDQDGFDRLRLRVADPDLPFDEQSRQDLDRLFRLRAAGL